MTSGAGAAPPAHRGWVPWPRREFSEAEREFSVQAGIEDREGNPILAGRARGIAAEVSVAGGADAVTIRDAATLREERRFPLVGAPPSAYAVSGADRTPAPGGGTPPPAEATTGVSPAAASRLMIPNGS